MEGGEWNIGCWFFLNTWGLGGRGRVWPCGRDCGRADEIVVVWSSGVAWSSGAVNDSEILLYTTCEDAVIPLGCEVSVDSHCEADGSVHQKVRALDVSGGDQTGE